MSFLPVCETIGLINLCSPAPLIEAGAKVDVGHAWFILQIPNLIWFLTAFILVILGIFLPFPTREVDTRGYETAGENGS
jgi:hypothetical protein